MRLLRILLSVSLGFALKAAAYGVGGSNIGTTTNRSTMMPYYGWNVEGQVQFTSLANETDAMIGSGLYYELTDFFDVGVQTLLSTNAGGHSTVRLTARQYITEGRTKLFFQPALGYNLHRRQEDAAKVVETGSVSADVGIKHRLYKDLHIGGTSGLELMDRSRYYQTAKAEDDYVLTPRVALVTNVEF